MKNKIVNWIRQQVNSSKAKGIVLGLSGGIDSSVVAALARAAVGKKNVLGLILPCHSQRQDLEHALLVAAKLGVKTQIVDLSLIYDTLMKILPASGKMAMANLKPRLRMLILYYFANALNYLVSGTGNKSEIMVGYSTKFGDSAADILPIAGLLKRDVVRLAKELGIPSAIIQKPPTAGLWPGQTDEGEMGITYDLLDDILDRIDKGHKHAAPKEKIAKVKKMILRSQHKRIGPLICDLQN